MWSSRIVPPQVRAAAALELRRRVAERALAATLALATPAAQADGSTPASASVTAGGPRPNARPYAEWLAEAKPEHRWTARHFRVMQTALDRVTRGELRRVYFSVPIRHGKTEHNSIGYGSYRIEDDPRTKLIVTSYNQPQANLISRRIRQQIRLRGVMMGERDAVVEWETAAGGGVRAVGAGSGLASVNADGIIIDDPIGSREDAESPAHRNHVWDWITDDVLARCDPRTWVLFTMSRWHDDDPAGRLVDRQRKLWHIIDMPGAAEVDAKNPPARDAQGRGVDELGRTDGEPLWPAERGATWLDEKRVEFGEYGFASLIQGRPRPRTGAMFKWEWWQLLDVVPEQGYMIRYWDMAGTQPNDAGRRPGSHDPDYTTGTLACRMADKRTAIVNVARFRLSLAGRDAAILQVCQHDLDTYHGRVRWWVETETGIGGTDRTANLIRSCHALGMAVSTEHATGSKVLRAEPLASAAEAGNIVLCPDPDPALTPPIPGIDWPGPWRDRFRLEAGSFPSGKHDDQVDTATGAFSKLSTPPRVARVFTVRL